MKSTKKQKTDLTLLCLRWHVFMYAQSKRSGRIPSLPFGKPIQAGHKDCKARELDAHTAKAYGNGFYCALAYPTEVEDLTGSEPMLIKRITVAAGQVSSEFIEVRFENYIGKDNFFTRKTDLTPFSIASHLWNIVLSVALDTQVRPKQASNRNQFNHAVLERKKELGCTTREALEDLDPAFPKLSKDDQAKLVKAVRDAERYDRTKKVKKVNR